MRDIEGSLNTTSYCPDISQSLRSWAVLHSKVKYQEVSLDSRILLWSLLPYKDNS